MIIGISGKLETGKTTLTKSLLDYGMEELLFAGPLKDMICSLLRCTREELEDQTFKNTPVPWITGEVTPRVLMQTLGTEWGRNIDSSLWANRVIEDAKLLARVVISDVRFPNEVEAVQEAGGIVVRIERDMDRSGPQHQHPSETALDEYPPEFFNVLFKNNGSMSDLKAFASHIFHSYNDIKAWNGI